MIQKTFFIVKPDAVERNLVGRVLSELEGRGFRIDALNRVRLTREQAEGFYAEHRERPFFGSLVEFMTSGPVVLGCLEAEDAVARLRLVVGATDPTQAEPLTIRRMFAIDKGSNTIHASDSPASAERELGYFQAQLSGK